MSRVISVTLTCTVADDADADSVAGHLFSLAADDTAYPDLESVDDYESAENLR